MSLCAQTLAPRARRRTARAARPPPPLTPLPRSLNMCGSSSGVASASPASFYPLLTSSAGTTAAAFDTASSACVPAYAYNGGAGGTYQAVNVKASAASATAVSVQVYLDAACTTTLLYTVAGMPLAAAAPAACTTGTAGLAPGPIYAFALTTTAAAATTAPAASTGVVQFTAAITGAGAGAYTATTLAAALNAAGASAGFTFAVFSATASSATALSAVVAVSGLGVSTAAVNQGFPAIIAGVSSNTQTGAASAIVCDSALVTSGCTIAALYTAPVVATPTAPAVAPPATGVVQFTAAITGPGAGALTTASLAAALNMAGASAGFTFVVFSVAAASATSLSASIAVSGVGISTATVNAGFPQIIAAVSSNTQPGAVSAVACDSAAVAGCTVASPYAPASPGAPALPPFCQGTLPNPVAAAADIACWVGTETATASNVALVTTPGARFCGAFTDVATGATRTYQTLSVAQMNALTAQFSSATASIPFANIAVCSTAACDAPAADPCRVFRAAGAAAAAPGSDFATSSKIGLGVGITAGVIFFTIGMWAALGGLKPAAAAAAAASAPAALELKAVAV